MNDIINTACENYIVIIVIVIAIILYLFRNKIKGKLGEIKVSNTLNELDRDEYKVIDNIILYSDNKTHEIDNIVVSKYGLFIIEMNNYLGKVSGDKEQRNWTQYIGKKINKFYNPVKQNYGHMKCVSDVLKLDMRYLIPIVVFSNDTYIDSDVRYVIHLRDLNKYIMRYKKNMYLDVDEIYEKLISLNIKDKSVKKKHINSINKRKNR